jgi:hypothetical protein
LQKDNPSNFSFDAGCYVFSCLVHPFLPNSMQADTLHFFNHPTHSELVDIIASKFSREQKQLTKPTAFIVVKERKGDGSWSKAGQTDSIPHSSDPQFARPVTVTYRGAAVTQQIAVEVFTHAPGARNGVSLGECALVLDDLVHARASRVMKLPLASPDRAHTNGIIVINAVVADCGDRDDGLWMQLQLAAAGVPKARPVRRAAPRSCPRALSCVSLLYLPFRSLLSPPVSLPLLIHQSINQSTPLSTPSLAHPGHPPAPICASISISIVAFKLRHPFSAVRLQISAPPCPHRRASPARAAGPRRRLRPGAAEQLLRDMAPVRRGPPPGAATRC